VGFNNTLFGMGPTQHASNLAKVQEVTLQHSMISQYDVPLFIIINIINIILNTVIFYITYFNWFLIGYEHNLDAVIVL